MTSPNHLCRLGRDAPPFAQTRLRACRVASVLGALAFLSACASTPAPVLLALPASVSAAKIDTPAANAPARAVLLVRRLAIPEYMAALRVRYRSDASTLAEWPNTFWAERIEVGMAREFVVALRNELPGWVVCDANCGERPPELSVRVDLQSLDFVRSERRLRASAQIEVSVRPRTPCQRSEFALDFDLPVANDTAQGRRKP